MSVIYSHVEYLREGNKLIGKERKTQEKRKIIAARQAKDVNAKEGKRKTNDDVKFTSTKDVMGYIK